VSQLFVASQFRLTSSPNPPDKAKGKNSGGLPRAAGARRYAAIVDLAVQLDNKAVAVGFVDSGAGDYHMVLVRFTSDRPARSVVRSGRRRHSLLGPNGSGRYTIGQSVALQPDGRIVAAGYSNSVAVPDSIDTMVARYTANGTPDMTFGNGRGFVIWNKGGRHRAGRSEDKLLGTLEADDQAAAERLAAEKWPGLRLSVERQTHSVGPTSPPRGR